MLTQNSAINNMILSGVNRAILALEDNPEYRTTCKKISESEIPLPLDDLLCTKCSIEHSATYREGFRDCARLLFRLLCS